MWEPEEIEEVNNAFDLCMDSFFEVLLKLDIQAREPQLKALEAWFIRTVRELLAFY